MKPATIIFLVVLVLFNFKLFGKDKINWNHGVIKLNSGVQLKGNVNYNLELDIVSFQEQATEKIMAFTASKVESFELFDEEIEAKRTYISIDFDQASSYKTKVFFELLLKGEISLLRRNKAFNQVYTLRAETLSDNFNTCSYYAYRDADFINLRRFKSKLVALFRKEFELEIMEFVKDNNLRLNRIEDQVIIIDYYNFLYDPKRKMEISKYLISLSN